MTLLDFVLVVVASATLCLASLSAIGWAVIARAAMKVGRSPVAPPPPSWAVDQHDGPFPLGGGLPPVH